LRPAEGELKRGKPDYQRDQPALQPFLVQLVRPDAAILDRHSIRGTARGVDCRRSGARRFQGAAEGPAGSGAVGVVCPGGEPAVITAQVRAALAD